MLVSAIVGREEVPKRLRDLLNVESGLNDGLALPVVLVLLAAAGRQRIEILPPLEEAIFGIAVGVAVPLVSGLLLRSRFFAATEAYLPLLGVTIGLIVLSATFLSHANAFLGAFAAGFTLATVEPEVRDSFQQFGELLTELLKLAALLIFGSLITIQFFTETSASSYVFALLALVAARPAALAIALAGSGLTWREWFTAAWFGPKGFSSVTYSLLILTSGAPQKFELYHLAGLVIIGSIVAHSSTDVLVVRWFRQAEPEQAEVS